MAKVIIEHHDEIEPAAALECALQVVREGRVSEGRNGSQYCFATRFRDGIVVIADRTPKGTDKLTVEMGREVRPSLADMLNGRAEPEMLRIDE